MSGQPKTFTAADGELFFVLLYPVRGSVSASKLRGWYEDAAADGEVETGLLDIFEQAAALEDFGAITLQGTGR